MSLDKAKALFVELISNVPQDEWDARLADLAGGDEKLHRQVARILAAHRDSGSFLESPAPDLIGETMDEPPSEVPGTVIGGYKLLEQIGEGGMGTVWMAQQTEPVKRVVALKLIKAGMDSKQFIARFEAERQALAIMDHANIARVLDGGTTSAGRPYFVMDLVKGVPITRYCDEHRLTTRQRLELFIPVCQAVQHAHQKGIIHRDLKPSNVLVAFGDPGVPGVPKVIDFGVAKAAGQSLTEKTLVTGFGNIVGTLEYMSPEQAEMNQLDIDTRSDIYSLGVLLYELLTGTPPFSRKELEKAGMLEMLRVIREQEPSKPSTKLSTAEGLPTLAANRGTEPAKLTKLVRGELDWIVMKALDKDRTRRYETANGLAQDIERYLRDEPVEASPPSAIYRLRKFARKHRTLIGTAALSVSLLATAAVVSAWEALLARSAEQQALTARDNETKQLEQAKRSEARAEAVLKFFQDHVLAAARPIGEEGGLGREATIRAALDQAEPTIAPSFADQPLVEASIRNTLGVSYWYLGENELALPQQERSLAIRRQVLGPEHPDTLGAMNDLAIILDAQGKYQEALKLFEEVVEVKRRVIGPEDPITLRSVSNLATIFAKQGQFAEASKLCEETLQTQRRVLGPEDISTLRSTYNLAIMWRHLGRVDEARSQLKETIGVLRRVFGPEHQDTLRVMDELGQLLLDQGDGAEALKVFQESLQGKRRVLGATHEETLITLANLADALRAQGRLDEASTLALEAVKLHRDIMGPEHPQTLVSLSILATVYRDLGRFTEARQTYSETLSLARRIQGPATPETQQLMDRFAWMLATAADVTFRDPQYAVELAKEVVEHAPRHANKWSTLGVAFYQTGDWANAITALDRSEAISPERFTAVNGFFLAMAHWQLREADKAHEWYGKAVRAMTDRNQMANPDLMRFRADAAQLLGISSPK